MILMAVFDGHVMNCSLTFHNLSVDFYCSAQIDKNSMTTK